MSHIVNFEVDMVSWGVHSMHDRCRTIFEILMERSIRVRAQSALLDFA